MKDAVRVIVVDPSDETRLPLVRLIEGLGSIWLAETCTSYEGAAKAIAGHTPNLVIVGLDSDPEAGIKCVAESAKQGHRPAVLPTSRTNEGELILRAIRAGAREFLRLPTEPSELLAAVGRVVRGDGDGEAKPLGGRVISVVGSAGGVGTSSLAVNLAATLAAEEGKSVALVDFDLVLGVVDSSLDILPTYTLLDVAQNAERLDLTLLKRSMTRHQSGLYVLPRPLTLEDAAKIDPEALRRVIGLLKAAFTTVVIDVSKGLQASDFVAFEMSDVVLVTVNLELNCLRNTSRLLQLFRQAEGMIERVKIVVNRAGSKLHEIGVKKAEETLGLPIWHEVPDAPKEFAQSRSLGVPLKSAAPKCSAIRAFGAMAKEFQTAGAPRRAGRKSVFGRFAASLF